MILLPEVPPETEDGWMLTGKATNAECVSPPPPPPAPVGAAPEEGVAPKGKSPMKLEKSGGRALKRLGVWSERMGVVRDSVLAAGWDWVGGWVAGANPEVKPTCGSGEVDC